jgi:hypothetical protein
MPALWVCPEVGSHAVSSDASPCVVAFELAIDEFGMPGISERRRVPDALVAQRNIYGNSERSRWLRAENAAAARVP